MNDPSPPSQGLVAGKYQLVRMIGRGGMGSVWQARHVSLGTSSAIKFIEAEYADSQEARSRFDKEARAAATIQSKHAIQIYDHGVTEDGKPYIVMELLEGEPLDKTIERGPLTLQDTARILQQVCRGLARAHERGIIHRDLKPENIYLVRTPDEDEPVAKVLDFGIAKMQGAPGSGGGLTSSTKTGAVLGTPFYMSPEQARGLRNVDHRADVWSLGVIAFKCLTGRLPFDGESVGDLLVKICTAPVPVPSQLYPGIPPSFDAWFLRSLEREPDRRFSSVAEQSEALAAVAGMARAPATRSDPVGMMTTAAVGLTPSGRGSGAAYPPAPSGAGYAPTPSGPVVSATPGVTPPPGAMTNAPFTSESIPGVPTGRGKLIAGVAVAMALIGAVIVVVARGGGIRGETARTAAGVGVVGGASSIPSAGASSAPAEDKAPPPAALPGTNTAAPTATATTVATPTPTTTAKARSSFGASSRDAKTTTPKKETTSAPPPPPLPTPTAEKPREVKRDKAPKDDPGY
jgi:serine/threonine-protein kinase